MDYGHTTQPTNDLIFPTIGTGTNDANRNDFEPEKNIDLTNQDWQIPDTIDHDKQALANTAMNPVELSMPPSSLEQTPPSFNMVTEHSLDSAPPPKIAEVIPTQPTNDTDNNAKAIKESLHPSLSMIGQTEDVKKEARMAIREKVRKRFGEDPADAYELIRGPGGLLDQKMSYYGENSNWSASKSIEKTAENSLENAKPKRKLFSRKVA